MKQLGVENIYIVSCIGASITAKSHYLRCKGEMEQGIEALGFNNTVFLQPGPLAGTRDEHRWDEWLLHTVMKIVNPIMKGKLLNYKPIEADVIADAMLSLAFTEGSNPPSFNTVDIAGNIGNLNVILIRKVNCLPPI